MNDRMDVLRKDFFSGKHNNTNQHNQQQYKSCSGQSFEYVNINDEKSCSSSEEVVFCYDWYQEDMRKQLKMVEQKIIPWMIL